MKSRRDVLDILASGILDTTTYTRTWVMLEQPRLPRQSTLVDDDK